MGRATDTSAGAEFLVSIDGGFGSFAIHGGDEFGFIEANLFGVTDQAVAIEFLLIGEEEIIVFPEFAELFRGFSGLVGERCIMVHRKREAAEDEFGFAFVLGRAAVPVINDKPDYKFEIGKGQLVREGKDVTIVATGIMVDSAIGAAEKLAAEGIDAEFINICTIKPIDKDIIIKSAQKTGKVVTCEEHSVIGGLGSAVCEVLADEYPVKVKRIGMQDVFGESGSASDLTHKYGLDAEGVYKQVKEFV